MQVYVKRDSNGVIISFYRYFTEGEDLEVIEEDSPELLEFLQKINSLLDE